MRWGDAEYAAERRANNAERVLSKAAELFAAHGFCEVTMEELSDALNATKPFVYYYYKSKDHLMAAILAGAEDAAETAKQYGVVGRTLERVLPLIAEVQ